MSNKTFTLYFCNVEQVHLGKDVFLTPYYLGKELVSKTRIVYPMTSRNQNLPSEYKGVKLIPICYKNKPIKNRFFRLFLSFLFILRYFVLSNYSMLFHYYSSQTIYLGIIYKTLNPFGKLYLKLDADITALKYRDEYKNAFQKVFWDAIHCWFAKIVDCVSCETTIAMNAIKESKATCYKFKDHMILMPNGFDEEELNTYDMDIKEFDKKENIFITVGRLGSFQKNTEMILDALSKTKLYDWKFFLIGSIEDSFIKQIDIFYKNNPDKIDNVSFLGVITDKKKLWEYYNRSKVFVLPSRFEGCALVFTEAKRFSNFIVSTRVGSFEDLVSSITDGVEISQEDSNQLAIILNKIISGAITLSRVNLQMNTLSWADCVKTIAKELR